jgi:hypothetical protein
MGAKPMPQPRCRAYVSTGREETGARLQWLDGRRMGNERHFGFLMSIDMVDMISIRPLTPRSLGGGISVGLGYSNLQQSVARSSNNVVFETCCQSAPNEFPIVAFLRCAFNVVQRRQRNLEVSYLS